MPRIDAIDYANYTDVPTPARMQCLREAGIRRHIIGASFGNIAPNQIAAALREGFGADVFGWLQFKQDPRYRMDIALARCVPGVRDFWIDCEEDTTGLTVEQVLARIQWAFDYVEAQRPDLQTGVYTGGWWWRIATRNSTRFSDKRLWFANYVNDPSQHNIEDLLFGGWHAQNVVHWQYRGTVQICETNTDWNITVEEDEDMTNYYTKQETDAKVGELLRALATQGGQLVAQGKTLNAVAGAFFNHVQTHPGGGPSLTMIGELEAAVEAHKVSIAKLEEFFEKVKAAAELING